MNILCYKPVRFVFRAIFGDKIYAKQGHRELPHSPIGIFCMSAFLTLYIWLVCFALSFIPGLAGVFNNPYIFIFGSAFFFGCLMHIIEDTCDIAGIHYFYPFSFRRTRGKIVGDGTDVRPKVFAVILICAAGVLAVLSIPGILPSGFIGVIAAVILWIIFLKVSGVPAAKQNRDLGKSL